MKLPLLTHSNFFHLQSLLCLITKFSRVVFLSKWNAVGLTCLYHKVFQSRNKYPVRDGHFDFFPRKRWKERKKGMGGREEGIKGVIIQDSGNKTISQHAHIILTDCVISTSNGYFHPPSPFFSFGSWPCHLHTKLPFLENKEKKSY